MRRIVYLTFYFKPDLCAGSFRNSTLAEELAKQASLRNIIIDLYTTIPNRYSTYSKEAQKFEQVGNLRIHRISLPSHKNGFIDQIKAFFYFYTEVLKLNSGLKCDLVFASSSRLFTAFLGYRLAKKEKSLLYLDIRDLFVDTIGEVVKPRLVKIFLIPLLNIIEKKVFNYSCHINLISSGFIDHVKNKYKSRISSFSNGIDNEFYEIYFQGTADFGSIAPKKVLYAGNLGDGQGLHKILPQAAKKLGSKVQFVIIGDGSCKVQLMDEILRLGVNNIILKNPLSRKDLIEEYKKANYLFLHLNDYLAFKKVLPSKIFELVCFRKPIIAGVSGYAATFIKSEISGSVVFNPCDINTLVTILDSDEFISNIDNDIFINKYKRSNIDIQLAESIISYL